MTYSSEIPDYRKFEYLIADLNIFLISGHGGEAFLLNDSIDDSLEEIQRLAKEYRLTIPTWVQRYIDTPKGTNEKI